MFGNGIVESVQSLVSDPTFRALALRPRALKGTSELTGYAAINGRSSTGGGRVRIQIWRAH